MVKYKNYCIENRFVEKSSTKISLLFLKKFIQESKQLNKKSMLILNFKDGEESIVLECYVKKGN